MTRVLLTAYGPYDDWAENSSWLTLQALMRDLPSSLDVTTRLYPVDFDGVRRRLQEDHRRGFDVALHLGQAPNRGGIGLEAFGLNIARRRGQRHDEATPLAPDGPAAYQSTLPLGDWARMLRAAGAPASVSFYAGDYLCNAALYLSHYYAQASGRETAATFLHVPLDVSQAIAAKSDAPSLPVEVSAMAVRLILEDLWGRAERGVAATGEGGIA